MSSKGNSGPSDAWRIGLGIGVKSIVCGVITVILSAIVMKGSVTFTEMQSIRNLAYALILISFGIAVLSYITSALYRKALLRVIPCCHRPGSPVILTQIYRNIIIFLLTFTYSLLIAYFEFDYSYIILYYRAFNRLFHSPFAEALETFILFIVMAANQSNPLPYT